MIHNGEIYANPVVPAGFYFLKVDSVEEEPSEYVFPKLLITLAPHHTYGLPENTFFKAIIHPTPASYLRYKNFFNTYMLGEPVEDLEKAIGYWGSVRIDQAKYGETVYSSIQFVHQPLQIRIQSYKLRTAE